MELKEFFGEKQEEFNAEKEKEKRDLLINLGIYEKVYSPTGECSDEYPFFSWNDELHQAQYYKIVTEEITDEEFEELQKLSNITPKTNSNAVATTLSVIAWITFLLGIVSGIVMGTQTEEFIVFLVYTCVSFISGMMLLGFAEIIKLLNDIKNK